MTTAGAPAAPESGEDRRWPDACLAALLLAIDPSGLKGAVLRAGPGPARERWLALLADRMGSERPLRKMPAGIGDERLLGGLDLAATLRAGRPIAMTGLLGEAHGGLVVAAMAERMSGETAARLALALDRGAIRPERTGAAEEVPTRLGLVMLDEGIEPEEAAPAALTDRVAFAIDLTGYRGALETEALPDGAALEEARRRLPDVAADEQAIETLVHTAAALGVASLRAPMLALRAARAMAALDGRTAIETGDCALAARLVLAPRATQIPAEAEDAPDEEPPPPEDGESDREPDPPPDPKSGETPEEIVVAAAKAALPRDLLETLKARGPTRGPAAAGRRGQAMRSMTRGRPVGVKPGMPRPGERLDVVETLRAAAPWQRLRRAETPEDAPARIEVRRDDFRLKRFKRARDTCTIFVVDASGSSALNRLAEAKGAVELLLAECYSRRDQVALITFAGRLVDLALPPTRSLVRAKRLLAGLPGGGGTPLANAIEAAGDLADALQRRGRTPAVVLMTDGRANITREGEGAPAQAAEEAQSAARAFSTKGHAAILVDIAPRPREAAQTLSQAMGARYLALPRADARSLSAAVRGATGR